MANKDSALNGLRRALTFVQDTASTTDRLYSSKISAILEICSLSQAIEEAATRLLEREKIEGIPQLHTKLNSKKKKKKDSEFIGFDALEHQLNLAKSHYQSQGYEFDFSLRLTKPFKEVDEVESADNCNPVEAVQVEDIPIDHKDQEIKNTDTSKECEKPKEHFKHNPNTKITKVPKLFVTDFKTILKNTATQISKCHEFEEELTDVGYISNKLSVYFEKRFDARIDSNKLHKFDRTQFKNYLASLVLSYGVAIHTETENQWDEEMREFLHNIDLGRNKYTLPKSAAKIFFDLRDANRRSISSLDDESVAIARELWDELWEYGYYMFNKFNRKGESSHLYPTANLAWLDEDFARIHTFSSTKIASRYDEPSDDREISQVIDDTYEACCDMYEDFSEYVKKDYVDLILTREIEDYLELSDLPEFRKLFARFVYRNPDYKKVISAKGFQYNLYHLISAILFDSYTYQKNPYAEDTKSGYVSFEAFYDVLSSLLANPDSESNSTYFKNAITTFMHHHITDNVKFFS